MPSVAGQYGAAFRQPTCPKHESSVAVKVLLTHPKIRLSLFVCSPHSIWVSDAEGVLFFVTQGSPKAGWKYAGWRMRGREGGSVSFICSPFTRP